MRLLCDLCVLCGKRFSTVVSVQMRLIPARDQRHGVDQQSDVTTTELDVGNLLRLNSRI